MSIELKVPAVGESITEVEIGEWLKREGDTIRKDENIVIIETEKATVELPAPSGGRLGKILKTKGQTASIGEVIGMLEASADGEKKAEPPAAEKSPAPDSTKAAGAPAKPDESSAKEKEARMMPAARRVVNELGIDPSQVKPSGPGNRILKEDVLPGAARSVPAPTAVPAVAGKEGREEEVVRMSRLRRTVAERLVSAHQNAALLTTFNEVDMGFVMALRKEQGEDFQKRYGVKLGFMSFFVKAVIDGLKQVPALNAEIRGTDIVYKNYFDIGVAIGGGKGLVVPVLRNAERLSFADIERTIANFAGRARENKLTLEELAGGTFTISNGGVYGSLLSTPIVNPPQSGVLGMHTIQERPVARESQVVIRPMMYIALTYDHRIVDGREAVTFLKRVKDVIEDPARMLIEI